MSVEPPKDLVEQAGYRYVHQPRQGEARKYITVNAEGTVRRLNRKVKGKAAVKRHKRARRAS